MARGRKNTDFDVERRRALVAELYSRGKYQHEIAEVCGVDHSQISRDLKIIRQNWLASNVRNFDEAKAEELAKIDQVERECWIAWERSKTNYTKTHTRKKGNAKALQEMVKTEMEVIMIGDPRYMQIILSCIERRCNILGLDAAKKVDVSSNGERVAGFEIIMPADDSNKQASD